jgi:hypothetical protein
VPVNPNPVTGTMPPQQQGIAGALAIIENRLQAIEQVIFGAGYANQGINLGTVDNIFPLAGPAGSTGATSSGNRL